MGDGWGMGGEGIDRQWSIVCGCGGKVLGLDRCSVGSKAVFCGPRFVASRSALLSMHYHMFSNFSPEQKAV